MITVVFEEKARRSAAYDGDAQVGECEFQESGNVWMISHTGVRPEYGGRGIARELVGKVIEAARERKARIVPVCSYAQRMMEGKAEYADVL